MRRVVIILIGLLVVGSVGAFEDKQDITVKPINMPDLGWGDQSIPISITNNTDDLKFVTSEAEITFTDSYLPTNRRRIRFFTVYPAEEMSISADLLVPGAYGTAEVTIRLYDVVDTLDVLLPNQKFYEESFEVEFKPTAVVQSYIDKQVTLPPRVGEHPYFDNVFARLLFIILDEGKTIPEAADVLGITKAEVETLIRFMQTQGYISHTEDKGKLMMTVISNEEAQEAGELAEKTVDALVEMYTDNLSGYRANLDSMVAAGRLQADSSFFLNEGAVLFYTYPTVAALSLWYDLGQSFITRSAPLVIFDGTDLCNARIPQYMYMVHAGEELNGDQFFGMFLGKNGISIIYDKNAPEIDCESDFLRKQQHGGKVRWNYSEGYVQEPFVLDTSLVNEALVPLREGSEELLVETYEKLRDIAVKHGHERLTFAGRYWFWNLVADRTLEKLEKNGLLIERSNGRFRFSTTKKRG